MARYEDFWRPYVPVAARRYQAARQLRSLEKKGHTASPVHIDGRKIAATFWGKAWCSNLERYSDFANRLPRGRTYVRNGSVVDLRMARGAVTALVSGSDLYEVEIGVKAVAKTRWRGICRDCTGAIDSLVELLQGRLSAAVMQRICEPKTGLFPEPRDLSFQCSCPDWASMCKHVAAALYGVGARLDEQPELLFLLRGVDQEELIAAPDTDLRPAVNGQSSGKVLESGDLSAIFGIEMAEAGTPPRAATARKKPRAATALKKQTRRAASEVTVKPPVAPRAKKAKPVAQAKPVAAVAPKASRRRSLSAAFRKEVAERMKRYWSERRRRLGS